MVQVYTNGSCEGLKIVGLATERCHVVKGQTVRVYFKLSSGPPVGWPSIFGIIWQVVQYPLKLTAGVEDETVWIECDPEKVGPIHLKRLNQAVAQTNSKYQQGAQQQASNTRKLSQLDTTVQSQLDGLNRALFPNMTPEAGQKTDVKSAGSITAKLTQFFHRGKSPKV